MKIWKRFASALLAVVVMLSAMAPAMAVATEETPSPFPAGYQYPILPGTPEWDALQDNQEKIDACVVPQEILDAMTTEEVLETLLNYPLQTNIYAFNNVQAGVEVVYRGYSGEILETLLTRPDRAEVILRRYQKNPVSGENQFDTAEDQDTMEALMQMEEVKELYSEAQLLEIEQAVTEKYLLRKEDSYFSDDPLCEYFRIEMESAGGSPLPYTTVSTPNGTAVSVYTTGYELSATQKQEIHDKHASDYKSARCISDATTRYNCHSYAYYSTNTTTNRYWMDDPRFYFWDGSYTEVPTPRMNSRIFYYNGGYPDKVSDFHSGISINNSGTRIRSKWGAGCLWEHDVTDCPYYQDIPYPRYKWYNLTGGSTR